MNHPIVMPDGRVPCDQCDAAIPMLEAESNALRWERNLCDYCAEEMAEANPLHARDYRILEIPADAVRELPAQAGEYRRFLLANGAQAVIQAQGDGHAH